MSAIPSIGSGMPASNAAPTAAAAGAPVAPASAQSTAASGAAVAGSSSASSMSASSSISLVYSNVNMMLGSIDTNLAGNDMLKMAIALLILQTMMGKKSEGGEGEDLLGALAAGIMSQSGNASMMAMNSSYTSINVEQSVSMSHVQESYAGATVKGGGMNAMA